MVGALLGASACNVVGGDQAGSREEPTPTPIPTSVVPTNPTYVVQRGNVIRELQFSGRIAPVVEQELFFRTGGYVKEVYARRNDQVEEDDLLAELEVPDLKNQITQKEAELQSVQMDQERRITEAENSVRAANLRLAKLEASRSATQLVSARINLEKARIRLQEAREEYNKSLDRDWEKEEVREGYARAVRNAEWNVEVAEAQYQDALRSRDRIEYDVELAEMDLDLAEMRLSEIETGLEVTRTLLSLKRLEDQLADARISAPFEGEILSVNVIEGRQVQAYNPVMILADLSQLEVSADLLDSEMSELSEEMEVVAEFANQPGEELRGVIRRLPYPYGGGGLSDTETEEDSSVRITIPELDDSGIEYDVGDRLRITVEIERSEDTLYLPPQAVRTFEGRSFVVVQEETGQRRVDVRIGLRSDDRLEILDGVSEGQTVIAP
jgi:multidrug efflux pump subunit AcrA (membrane-fusion protein)